jgi:hypothetical protein
LVKPLLLALHPKEKRAALVGLGTGVDCRDRGAAHDLLFKLDTAGRPAVGSAGSPSSAATRDCRDALTIGRGQQGAC